MNKVNMFFKSKTFEHIINVALLSIWVFSGIAGFYTIPGTNLKLQWIFGVLFGMYYIQIFTQFATKMFWILYNNFSEFKKHVNEHWGNPE